MISIDLSRRLICSGLQRDKQTPPEGGDVRFKPKLKDLICSNINTGLAFRDISKILK